MTNKQTLKTPSRILLNRLVRNYMLPHKKLFVMAIIAMLVVSITTALTSYMIKPILDELFISQNKALYLIIPGATVLIYLIKGIAGYFQSYLMEYIGQRIVADFQIDLYKHVIEQDLTFHQAHPTANLSSRFIYDLNTMKKSLTQTVMGIMRDIPMAFGLVGVMLFQNWVMAFISFTILPLTIAPILIFGRHIRRYSVGTQEEMGSLSVILKESLGHIRQVKTYTMEPYEIARTSKSINNVFTFLIKAARVRALSSPFMEFLGGVVIAIVILYGAQQVWAEHMTTGAFFSFLTAAMMLYRPLRSISNINNQLQEGLAAADRAFQLMDHDSRIQDKPTATDLTIRHGEITFSHVRFKYLDGSEAIPNLNITIPAGKKVALVGASGAGKSTILNLIPRFFDPTDGQVLIDGQPITDVKKASLRKHISLVTQEIAMFDGTIAENIAYGSPGASTEQIKAAAKTAHADEFIDKLDHGYDTVVGEDGVKLSGGQKQRISIARAVLKDAPILLLDEATSNLDTVSEKHVQEALEELSENRTTLVVAHRLSTTRNADIIYVLDHGQIIEKGSHATLLEHGGTYARLYQLQENNDA